MSEQTLVIDTNGGWLTEQTLRSVEPTVDDLDEQLLALILCRAEYARRDQMTRRAEGLPARQLSVENDMVRRYAARLGTRGGEIAVAVLALSQRSAVIAPTSH